MYVGAPMLDVNRKLRILHVEDNLTDAELVREILYRAMDCEITRVETKQNFELALFNQPFDLILCDYTLPSFDGLSVLLLTREHNLEVPFIFLSGTIGEERAVESLKLGANDYILKGQLKRLVPAIHRALRESLLEAERQKAANKLKEQIELFQQITEYTDDLIAVLDLDGRRIFNSKSYQKLAGNPANLLGSDSFAEVHPDDRAWIKDIFHKTVATGVGQLAQYRFILPDGQIRHIESQGSVIRNTEGKVVRVVVVSRDITEQRKTEIKMLEQAELLDQVPDAIFACDLEQRIVNWNKSAEKIYGWASSDVIGKTADIIERENQPRREEKNQALLTKGEWRGELKQVTKQGDEIVVASRAIVLRDGAKKPTSILNINTDITQQKQLESQLLRIQRLEKIGTLSSGIAHDLNNILAPILIAADVLRSGLHSETELRVLETVKTSAVRGAELVKQIVRFAKGDQALSSPVQIQEPIKEMLNLVKDTLPKSITIETHIEGDLHLVCGDGTQLRQLLLNLLVNARDAMPTGGKLTVSGSNIRLNGKSFSNESNPVSGEFVLVSVADTGVGIPAHLMNKIFQPFFTTKGNEKGTGVGLSTVANIVRSHNGFIEVVSTLGKGANFQIYLPAFLKTAAGKLTTTGIKAPPGHGELILFLNDESAASEITKVTLEAYQYRVLTASSETELLRLVREHRNDAQVVIVDVAKPAGLNSMLFQTLRELVPTIKIIHTTSNEVKPIPTNGKDSPDNVLKKPYAAEALLDMLAKTIRQPILA